MNENLCKIKTHIQKNDIKKNPTPTEVDIGFFFSLGLCIIFYFTYILLDNSLPSNS